MSERHLSRRLIDALFLFQLALTVGILSIVIVYTISTANEVSQLNQRQIEYVQNQNQQQICNQIQALTAIKAIGDRLGLDTSDIVIPKADVECPR